MSPRAYSLFAACAVTAVLMPARLAAQDTLAAARQLYASAEYTGALTMLNGLLATSPAPQDRYSIELYRIFCLVALGSTEDANKAVEAMIVRDPLQRPNAEEVPPRLRTVFSDARRRLLPSIIQQKYVLAKTAFDRSDFKAASEGFTQVMLALSDPDLGPAAEQSPLSDLRLLASSFNDLTVRNMAPPPAPKVVEAAPPSEPAAPRAPAIHSAEEPNVVPPVAIRQDVPPFPGNVTFERNGVVDIVISENGAVESSTLVEGFDARYNRLLLAAVKTWQYRPARLDGIPVKFRKRLQITLTPERQTAPTR